MDNILLLDIIGFVIFIIIFVLFIPYILIINKNFELLSAYFPNLDILASIIQYNGGPFNYKIWNNLYLVNDKEYLFSFITKQIIDYFALIGVSYIIAYYTLKNKNINSGFARALIMLPMTYLIPSTLIIYFMKYIGNIVNLYISKNNIIHYIILITIGLLVALFFIIVESKIIYYFSETLINIIKNIKNQLNT